jgi:hypothetical protein
LAVLLFTTGRYAKNLIADIRARGGMHLKDQDGALQVVLKGHWIPLEVVTPRPHQSGGSASYPVTLLGR